MAEIKKYGGTGPESLSDAERPSDNLEIDEIMAKLEQVREGEEMEGERGRGRGREGGRGANVRRRKAVRQSGD